MYATTVGLVLSGYHGLEERSPRSLFDEEPRAYVVPTAAVPVAPAPQAVLPGRPVAAPAPEPKKEPKQPSRAAGFFKDILSRTKGLLIDDYDDKSY